MMQIERIETHWASPDIQAYAESLQDEIRRAMAIPEHLMRPDTAARARREAWERTEVMRRELTRLYVEYTFPMGFARIVP